MPYILLGVLGIFGVVFYFYNKSQTQKEDTSNISNKDKNKNKNSSSGTKSADVKKDDVFNFMEFDKIQDGMIVQNKGTKYTMAIKCKGVNYDLMSDVEQLAVEEGFITFLNTLRYPIQLYVQAQNIDLKGAINTYKSNVANINDEFNQIDREYQKVLESFEASEEDIDKIEKERSKVKNVYEYANDIINYVEVLGSNKALLQRSFYVLLSYYTSEINASSNFSKEEVVNMCYNELLTRAKGICSALAGCGVEGKVLNSNELADLLYNAYNRDDKGLIDVKNALESGFYRLYSTSKDAYEKKEELLEAEIEKKAKLKAYKAIKTSIENGTYVSDKAKELQNEEVVSRVANEIVKREDVPVEVKKDAQKNIIEEYRQDKRKILLEINDEKQEKLSEANKEIENLTGEKATTQETNKVEETSKDLAKEIIKQELDLRNEEENIAPVSNNNVKENFFDDSEDDSII